MPRRRTICLYTVLLLHTAFHVALILWSWLGAEFSGEWGFFLGILLAVSQINLLAAWVSLSPVKWYLRHAALLGFLGVVPTEFALFAWEHWIFIAVLLALPAAVLYFALICLRAAGMRWGVAPDGQERLPRRPWQFSIASIFVWTLVAAVATQVLQGVVATWPDPEPPKSADLGEAIGHAIAAFLKMMVISLPIMYASTTLVMLWSCLGRSSWLVRIPILLIGVPACATIPAVLFAREPETIFGAFALGLCVVLPFAAIALATMLPLRFGGYRLMWGWDRPETTTSGTVGSGGANLYELPQSPFANGSLAEKCESLQDCRFTTCPQHAFAISLLHAEREGY